MTFWRGRRVLVTGGSGFLGSRIVRMVAAGGAEVAAPRSSEFNLIHLDQAKACFESLKPDLVIHCAAFYGGIWMNRMHGARIFHDNLIMGANVIEAARQCAVGKLLTIGSACAYPDLEGDLREEQLWQGLPHESVENYGTVKRMIWLQGRVYNRQYGMNIIHLMPTNLYGPGDTFDAERSHVASALIRKFVEAKQDHCDTVVVWGTGDPVREYMYVEDCAAAIVRAAEVYSEIEPLNIGSGEARTIRELADVIAKLTGFRGRITWDTSKPNGQMRKVLDITRMNRYLQWSPPFGLEEGLRRTIDWYVAHKATADLRR